MGLSSVVDLILPNNPTWGVLFRVICPIPPRRPTGTYSSVQSASVSNAQRIYHVSATNDYRAVNWHTSPNAPYGRQRRRAGYYVWPTGIQGTSSPAISPTSNMANEQLMTEKPLVPLNGDHDPWTWVRRMWKPKFGNLGKVVAQSRF